jgi:hypothetical protein
MKLTHKRKERVIIFNATDSDFELLTLAAQQKEISRSELIRQALRKEASRVLAGVDSAPAESAS